MGSLREASTVCLVRDAAPGLEVLMVQRTPSARFMGGAWVFPGGAVDSLWYFANWITPAPLPTRFDTRFFAAPVPPEFRST